MNINPDDLLKNERWLDIIEIKSTLDGISHIIMAAPTGYEDEKKGTIHFALYLNTEDDLPADIARNVLEKFAFDNQINGIDNVTSALSDVAFAMTNKGTAMPIALEEPNNEIPSITMYLIDFTGRSDLFKQASEGMTGWTYVRDI